MYTFTERYWELQALFNEGRRGVSDWYLYENFRNTIIIGDEM